MKITHTDGTVEYVTMERADEPIQEGTPINKALFDSIKNDLKIYVIGTYVGNIDPNNYSGSQFISLGFTPKAVYCTSQNPETATYNLRTGNFGLAIDSLPFQSNGGNLIVIENNGFRVYQSSKVTPSYYPQNMNHLNKKYMYIAFK